MGRPPATRINTDDIVEMLKKEGRKKIDGYEKMAILLKGLFYNALPKDENGKVVPTGQGKMDLKAAGYLLNRIYGKPSEQRKVQVDIFRHLVDAEKSIDISEYKVTWEG